MNAEITSGNKAPLDAINLTVLNDLKELQQSDQPDFVTELIELFLHDTTSQLEIMRAAVLSNDVPEVRRVAHLMKGSSANIGATRMSAIYQELETVNLDIGTAGRNRQTLISRLEDEFQQVSEALKTYRLELGCVTR
ncbi:MAG: Hpt domain-containing protein [Pyrinomonadaceae bacterium]